jgi:hypothetical protein
MSKKWMPKTAGILNIIGGVFQSILSIIFIAVFLTAYIGSGWNIPADPGPIVLLVKATGPLLITGVISIIGGISATMKKRWILSLAGSILAFFTFSIAILVITDWRFIHVEDFPMIWEGRLSSNLALYTLYILPILLGVTSLVFITLSKKQFERN